ncbi:MAG: prephenate dehydrogenase [Eubacterium sp.]|nr:prephenate dehydrogenase [Eubacterium sp.]
MKRIGFFGLGLIGGSLAKTIRKYHPDWELLAWNRTQETLEAALRDGVIDAACSREDARFGACDYIFLCAPVQTNLSFLPFLKTVIQKNCIISDVGSVKNTIVSAAATEGLSACFIGGHPMAGSERTGLSSASDTLLENAYYFLTPCAGVPQDAVAELKNLIAECRAIPIVTTAAEHDYIVAGVSHIPHIVASALVNLVRTQDTDDQLMKLVAAGGFRDITRIASSSPDMWEQICLSNQSQIASTLESYIGLLTKAKDLISSADGPALHEMFRQSRDYRDSLSDSRSGPVPRQYVIYLDICDEAGGIATVTTLLAMSGLNIRNLGIVHNREFEEGVLRIEFYDAKTRDHAVRILQQRNYVVRKQT